MRAMRPTTLLQPMAHLLVRATPLLLLLCGRVEAEILQQPVEEVSSRHPLI